MTYSYSVENNRGHDDYTIDPYDFFDTCSSPRPPLFSAHSLLLLLVMLLLLMLLLLLLLLLRTRM
jgi:hypothetical protein